ncbi:TIGR03808 family TAT-translocated repetitive protein [Taklimakanibacter lacteus]|uniref:TIGR03808 family TAT-translocated repetitive protein n=1 Tax=Taklimakanibacter lacteus TaxID=2268456 RepID=UPI000E65F450
MDFSRRIFMSAAPVLAAGTVSAGPALAASAPASLSAAEFGLKPNSTADQSATLSKAVAKASERGLALLLPGGRYQISDMRIDRPVVIQGVAGQTKLVTRKGTRIFTIEATDVVLDGIGFEGSGDAAERDAALVAAQTSERLTIVNCAFRNFAGSGLELRQCSGRIAHNRIGDVGMTGIFALDSTGLEIASNHITDIGNNAIQVWTSDQRQDGTIVTGNRIERVRFDNGGTGQNGNGVVVFRAGNVTVSGNRISDCAFSAIRNNSGRNCQIVNNSCSRLYETAIYVEFAFDGAVVSGNLVETAATGISITNFNEGGRLAVCANNVIRDITGGGSQPDKRGLGIGVEADTIVTGNVVEAVSHVGITAGWGAYARNILITGNLVRQCPTAITLSVSKGAGAMTISGNMIAQSPQGIIGMDYTNAVTGDLALGDAIVPANLKVSGNSVT